MFLSISKIKYLSQSKNGLNPINPNSTSASINPKSSSATHLQEQPYLSCFYPNPKPHDFLASSTNPKALTLHYKYLQTHSQKGDRKLHNKIAKQPETHNPKTTTCTVSNQHNTVSNEHNTVTIRGRSQAGANSSVPTSQTPTVVNPPNPLTQPTSRKQTCRRRSRITNQKVVFFLSFTLFFV